MTAVIHRPQKQILTNIVDALAIDHSFSHGLVSHDVLLGQKESEQVKQLMRA